MKDPKNKSATAGTALERLNDALRKLLCTPEIESLKVTAAEGGRELVAEIEAGGFRYRLTRVPATPNESARPTKSLTPREREISELVTQGLPNKMIADRLGISDRTVAAHMQRIFTKLQVESRVGLAVHTLMRE